MKVAIVTLNKASLTIAKEIKASLNNDQLDIFTLDKYLEEGIKPIVGKLKTFGKELFEYYECIIYVMAMGIIVRDIAPYLKHKSTDPAVVCVSVDGRFVIPVLSGHLGGANDFAKAIAKGIHAVPVITTASDLLGYEAVDMIAKRNDLVIDSFQTAMDLTARMINEEAISVISDGLKPYSDTRQIKSDLLNEYLEHDKSDGYIYIGYHKNIKTSKPMSKLIPKCLVIGIGARLDTPAEAIKALLVNSFNKCNLDLRAIKGFKSIDIKKNEQGIIDLAKELNVTFDTYSADELRVVSPMFEQSSFVEKVTGVGCVSMPSGYLGSNKGNCIVNKIANNGITISVWEEI